MGCSSGFDGFFGPMHTMRKTDVDKTTDNKPHMGHFVIGLLLFGPAVWVAILMGLFIWANIGLIAPIVIIGTAILSCGYYGTNRSIMDRFRYRPTVSQLDTIKRRLSDRK